MTDLDFTNKIGLKNSLFPITWPKKLGFVGQKVFLLIFFMDLYDVQHQYLTKSLDF